MASGEIVAFLDHDDFWVRPDHLAVGVEAMQQRRAGYYFTHVQFEPEQSDLMWAARPDVFTKGAPLSANALVVEVPVPDFLRVMAHSHVHPSHSIVRRSVWKDAGGFIEGLRTADDVNFMLRVADLSPVILLPTRCMSRDSHAGGAEFQPIEFASHANARGASGDARPSQPLPPFGP